MNPFERLAPFIQEFIWQQEWTELRGMQAQAIDVVLDSNHHVLLAGATASGKTEAAFLPILTELAARPSSSVGVLYLGPLKALINDQFGRLEALLEHAGVPVWPWHGDVGQGVKKRALKECRGILQTTPESLEGFFLYRGSYLQSLFGDLRYVVIDEVHAFMASDRGRQVLCQLARLEQLLNIKPRRIGLSATLGDYALAEAWLAGGAEKLVTTIDDRSNKRRIKLAVTHFRTADEEEQGAGAIDETSQFLSHLYGLAEGHKSLVFGNSRAVVEEVGAGLREVAERQRKPDIFFVHHGSISKDYRLAAEDAMREADRPACTVATVTLELGIDLGQLERVMQIGPSPTVSSFVQRLGRTGRRGEPGEMVFYILEAPPSPKAHPLERLPWELLLAIAQIQLYLEERWVEPITPPKYPYSLLYHQTMSTLAQHGELGTSELAQRVLTLPPFKHVGQDNYKMLLRHLLELDHLQWTERQRLLIGLAGERVVNDWRFLATFQDTAEYDVMSGSEHIGTLASVPPVETVIRLAGRTWLVKDVALKERVIHVQRAKGRAKTTWTGAGGGIHDRVVKRLKRVLEEDTLFAYLQESAKARLIEARELVKDGELLSATTHGMDRATLFTPWVGTRAYQTLRHVLRARLGTKCVTDGLSPFFMTVKTDEVTLQKALVRPATYEEVASQLDLDHIPLTGKFDGFIPNALLRSAYLSDQLDLNN